MVPSRPGLRGLVYQQWQHGGRCHGTEAGSVETPFRYRYWLYVSTSVVYASQVDIHVPCITKLMTTMEESNDCLAIPML